MSLFGNIFELMILYAVIKALYKKFGKGKNPNFDRAVNHIVSTVKQEMSTSKNRITKIEYRKEPKDDLKNEFKSTTKHANAEDLFKSGLITKEEYRKIKK